MTLLLLFLFSQQPPPILNEVKKVPVVETYGGESGVAKISRHWWDFHKQRDGKVTIRLHADLRAPIYRVRDMTETGASFLVVDPGYAHADHFTIRGKKGHRFSWSVAGRP